ncbi:MAG: acyl-CoA thioesterase [Gemmatimonadetes bacterium]|uniref:Acyl-CoA thioesterase n=1 Tax=Candidatus Kutchimonas denitrificans TaxID=3056748 RepID=A0AAE4Z650_9BACT|nr:acyl-CoA thioesterase [Candidatus Kutchimonas denitrificans]NIS02543.1 acyl-CoA thioesterase [Gemmatimonadota bacterium]NIT68419.1 acyl-CoA thioesterase [Gemmatimonadota bacterium]NIU51871.1 acyl-CoA thioesterase [Gemmatimonadota bacterium]NIV24974.1 acyl-CoA thioesterase [Gemmatimonadota bacterium]
MTVRIPVQWGELDAYGHLNNTVYFRHFESARIEYLDRCRFLEAYDRDRVGAILHSTGCRFRRPLFYPDTVIVGTRATEVEEDRFTMLYLTVSEAQDDLVAEGTGVIVSYDYVGRRPVPIPDYVREAIRELES